MVIFNSYVNVYQRVITDIGSNPVRKDHSTRHVLKMQMIPNNWEITPKTLGV
jgi:hypothetical protein